MSDSIFIFRIGSLGDSIVALPAIKKIHTYYNQQLHFITNKPDNGIFPAWELYKHTTYFEDVFEFEYDIQSIMRLRQYIAKIKGKKILYYFVDKSSFKRNFRNYLFFKLIGFDEIYGWKECIGKYILRDENAKLLEVESEYKRLENIVDKYISLNKNYEIKYDFLKFSSNFKENSKIKFNFLSDKFIVLGIGGKTKIQRWDIENYISVLSNLDTTIKIVILGGNDENKDANVVKNSLINREVINLCGETTILESAYILSKAKVYFGNDTGTLHLASIVGCKCLVISSARNNIGRWNPYGNGHKIIRKKVDCGGCFLSDNCQYDIKCMKDINKNEVLKKLEEILNDTK